MSDLELMDCWEISQDSRLGVSCMHTSPTSVHQLQEAVNGWLFMVLDPATMEPIVLYLLNDDPRDVAAAQHSAHEIIENELHSLYEMLDFYDEHSPLAISAGWCGPDPIGGYGRVIDGDLFIINGALPNSNGMFRMQRYSLRNVEHGFTPGMKFVEGGELDDVQKRAYAMATEWDR